MTQDNQPVSASNGNSSKIRYEHLFNSSVDGILILSYPDGEIEDANPSVTRLLGFSREDLIGKKLWQIGLIADKDAALDAYARLLKNDSVHYDNLNLQTKTGQSVPVEFIAEIYRIDHQTIIQCSIHNSSERKALQDELYQFHEEAKSSFRNLVDTLLNVVKFSDPYTANHQMGVADLAVAIATEVRLDAKTIETIRASGLIHDIGKVSIPSQILTKPTALNSFELALIQNHAKAGFDILKNLQFPWDIAKVVLQHHERLDGSGYPNKLSGNSICIEAKVIAIADTVEAMAHFRPYRPALGIEAALHEIELHKGTLFDSELVDACLKLFKNEGYQFPAVNKY